jgi:SAM-dependent methyltransferase
MSSHGDRSRFGLSFGELLRDRLSKHGLYDTPAYWDKKAEAYEGLARSIWPSNTYNRHWDERQMQLVDRMLGEVKGLSVADVACGTGRGSRHLARRGARITGLDFAPKTLEAARREAAEAGLSIDFRLFDALAAETPEDLSGRFDAVLSISCLSFAGRSLPELDRALANVVRLVRPSGRILFLEPFHAVRLVRRILKLDADSFIARAESQGLRLVRRERMGFIPVRFALAFRDFPDAIVRRAFDAGERALDRTTLLTRLADYHCLLFARSSV